MYLTLNGNGGQRTDHLETPLWFICVTGTTGPLLLISVSCIHFFRLKFDGDCKDASPKPKNYWINVKHYLQWQHRVPPPIPHHRVIWMISMEWKLRTKECWRGKLQLIGASIHLNVVFIVCKVIGCSVLAYSQKVNFINMLRQFHI